MSQQNTPKTSIDVRLANADDAEALAHREPNPDASFAEKHFELQEQGDYFLVVGFVGGEPGGYVVLDCREETDLRPEMKNLWVYPEFRRRGLGAALSQYLETLASRHGFDEIQLGVDPENPAAIPMYIGLDYTPTGHHRVATYLTIAEDGTETEVKGHDAIYRKSLRISA